MGKYTEMLGAGKYSAMTKEEPLGFLPGAAQQVGRNFDVAAANVGKLIPGLDTIGQILGLQSSSQVLAQRKDKPISTASQIAGDVATAFPAIATPGGIGAQALVGGALSGLTAKENQAEAALIGGALGGVGAGIGKAIAGARVTPEAKILRDNGVALTPGQLIGGGTRSIEDALAGIPLIGDPIMAARQRSLEQFNRGAYQQSLRGASEELPSDVGRAGVQQLKDIGGELYSKALGGTLFQADPGLAAAYQNIRGNLSQGAGGQGSVSILDNIVAQQNSRMTGTLTGEQYKGFESDLSKVAKSLKTDQRTEYREAGNALSGLVREMKSSLARQNPKAASELAKADKAYSGYKTISTASKLANEANDGLFTPQNLVTAIRQRDETMGKDAFARGAARMQDYAAAAQRVIPNKLPDSGTSQRALMTGLIAGGAGAAQMLSPSLAITGAALPALYSRPGIAVIEALLTQRNDAARKIGKVVSRGAIPATYPMREDQ